MRLWWMLAPGPREAEGYALRLVWAVDHLEACALFDVPLRSNLVAECKTPAVIAAARGHAAGVVFELTVAKMPSYYDRFQGEPRYRS